MYFKKGWTPKCLRSLKKKSLFFSKLISRLERNVAGLGRIDINLLRKLFIIVERFCKVSTDYPGME